MTRWKDTLPELKEDGTLIDAAGVLVEALRHDGWGYTMHRDARAQYAAAHIRAVRKQIEAEHGITSERVTDWYSAHPDDAYVWGALRYVSVAAVMGSEYESAAYYLRCAEAALRTLWRRGQE